LYEKSCIKFKKRQEEQTGLYQRPLQKILKTNSESIQINRWKLVKIFGQFNNHNLELNNYNYNFNLKS